MRSWSCIDYCLSQPQSSSKWCRQWRRLEPPGPTRDQGPGQCYHQPETPSEPEPVRQHSLCHVSSEHLMTYRNWYSDKSVICDTERIEQLWNWDHLWKYYHECLFMHSGWNIWLKSYRVLLIESLISAIKLFKTDRPPHVESLWHHSLTIPFQCEHCIHCLNQ